MEGKAFWQRRIFGIRYWELGLLFLFYAVFTQAYSMVIYLTSGATQNWFWNSTLDYALKAFLTIPIWWLLFKKLAHWDLKHKLYLHLLLLPVFVIVWQQVYYLICDFFSWGHLTWPGSWWDIYIPGLFYVLQFGIFHVYDYRNKLQEQQKLESELRQIALKSELAALKSQLNPHFLYNIFNTISASVPPEMENTREMIAKLSDLFRYQLKASKVELVPLHEEIEFVKKYLELEKARFLERLQFDFEIDEKLKNIVIPPMILQPLAENAVKHGISPKIEGGHVSISVQRKGEMICFEICDSGVGLRTYKEGLRQGVGLSNTRKRLAKMYRADLQLVENSSEGLCVKFEIPIVQVQKSVMPMELEITSH